MRVIGYVRVSTEEQTASGAGLESQRQAIEHAATQRGWQLVDICEDAGASGKTLTGREALQDALTRIEAGEVEGLVVAKLDRLSRSLIDFAGLMERSRKHGWALVALDVGVDTSRPEGEAMAGMLAVWAQFERRLIGQRTKDALAIKRQQGVRLGRPPVLPKAVVGRIKREARAGRSLREIARRLNRDQIPTAHGGASWHHSTIRSILKPEARVAS